MRAPYIFASVARESHYRSSNIRRRLKSVSKSICLMPQFHDFT